MTTATRRLALFAVVIAILGVGVGAYFYAGDGRAARKGEAARAGKGTPSILITSAVVQARDRKSVV